MGLRDYEIPTLSVPINEKVSFDVRGISFEDISRLVQRHGPVCVMVYQQFVESKVKFGLRPEVLGQLLTMAMEKFPDAVSEMIALAADDMEQIAKVRKLPVGVQIDAIYKIIGLTFTSEADVKKLVEIVTRMAVSVTANMNSLTGQTPSDSGNGSFVSQ